MIHLTIDEKAVEYSEQITILEAARGEGIRIPTLCHNDYIKPYGGCRLCLVEVATEKWPDDFRLMASCCSQIKEGQIVLTNTDKIKGLRKFVIELFLSRCPDSEELQKIAREVDVPDDKNALDPVGKYLLTRAKPLVETKCILCGLCVRACAEISQRHAISTVERGMRRQVVTPFGTVSETCIGCGACAYVCPTNAITIEEAA